MLFSLSLMSLHLSVVYNVIESPLKLIFEAPSYFFFSVEMMFLQRYTLCKHITHSAGNPDTFLFYVGRPNCRQNTAEEITF